MGQPPSTLAPTLTIRGNLRQILEGLGGAENLREILVDFYSRMAQDTMIGFFFSGKDIVEIAERQSQFLLRAMGEIPSFSGKSPAQAHTSLPPILPGHFDRRLRILEETLRAQGLAPELIAAWVQFENTFRDAIESAPGSNS